MPYCVRCGVELDGYVKECPLCRTPVPELDDIDTTDTGLYPPLPEEIKKLDMPLREKKQLSLIILTVCLIIPILLVLVIDLRQGPAITWSFYPMASLILAWFFAALPLFLKPVFYPIFLVDMTLLALFLWFIDRVSGGYSWFFPLGLPLTALFTGIVVTVVWLTRRAAVRGLNVVAYILTGVTLFTVAVDVLLRIITGARDPIGWSLIIVVSLLPVAAILLIIHMRPNLRHGMKKRFHL